VLAGLTSSLSKKSGLFNSLRPSAELAVFEKLMMSASAIYSCPQA